MIEQTVAHGVVEVGLRDNATPALHKVEAEYRATMSRIDRMEASAKIGADLKELDVAFAKAKDYVRILEGQKATVEIGADSGDLIARIKEAQAEVKRLDGLRATVQLEVRGTQAALAQIEAVRSAESARAAAEAKYSVQSTKIESDRAKAMASASQASRLAIVDDAKRAVQISSLRVEYSKLTDEIENANKASSRFTGPETKAKLNESRTLLLARMKLLKAELNALGSEPPVKIRVDNDYSDVESNFKKMLLGLRDTARKAPIKVLDTLGKVGDIKVFGNSLSTLIPIIGALAPVITSVVGAGGALIGVLGAGIAGAGAVAGGTLSGLILNLGGVKAALGQVTQDLGYVNAAYNAYDKTIKTYGANSKQGILAQEKLNSLLKSVDPLAAQAGTGFNNLKNRWQELTNAFAQKDVGAILSGGFTAINKLLPTLAKNTNATFGVLRSQFTFFEKKLSSPDGLKVFDSLGKSANQFLGPALHGLSYLADAIGHIAESAARLFAGPAGKGFEHWAMAFDAAVIPGKNLDDKIKTLGKDAADVIHLFADFGRLMLTVFGGGAAAGDNLINTFDGTLKRWNEFLKTTRGQNDLHSFFNRSVDDAKALFSALGPILAAFVQWSNLLAPFTTGILHGVEAVTELLAKAVQLTGLAGPFGALGLTIGAAFAVAKIGSFVSMVARAVTLMKELGAFGTVKAIFSGNFGSLLTAAKTAAAELEAGVVSGGRLAGAEIAAAMARGGAIGAGESALGNAPLLAGERAAAGELPQAVATTEGAVLGAGGSASGKVLALGEAGAAGAGGASLLSRLGGFAGSAGRGAALGGLALSGIDAVLPSGNNASYGLPGNDLGSRASNEFQNITHQLNPFGGGFDPIQAVVGSQDSQDAGLRAFGAQVDRLKGNINGLSVGKLQQIHDEAIALGKDPSLKKWSGGLAAIAHDFDPLVVAMGKVRPQFVDMASYAGKSFHDISLAAQVNMAQIENTLGTKSAGARAALSMNMRLAAADVQASMQSGRISTNAGMSDIQQLIGTKTATARSELASNFALAAQDIQASMNAAGKTTAAGLALINSYMTKALNLVGVNVSQGTVAAINSVDPSASSNLLANAQAGNPGSKGPSHGGTFNATGGRVPGAVGPDNWTLVDPAGNVAGYVGGAELLIANRHTENRASMATMAVYGQTLGQMVAGESTPHSAPGYATGGRAHATGGRESYSQLEGTWIAAGGAPGAAAMAAAIAEAESGGDPNSTNHNTNGTTDRGLWQINSIWGALSTYDVAANARAAVQISKNGSNWQPWSTFGNGSYQKFLNGAATPQGGASGSAPTVTHIQRVVAKGIGGAVGKVVQGVLDKVWHAANAKLAATASVSGGVGGGIAPGGATSGPGGLATFEGVTMAQWIANELAWGTAHGWRGQPTSGYRPGTDPHTASGTSEHALINYPGGAVDFGGYVDPGAYQTKLALVQLAARLNYPGPRLQMPIGFSDDGHLSGTGHALGGVMHAKRAGTGGKFNRPTLLVGEESRNEYVISTNPAHAFANGGYLAQAANALGYGLMTSDGEPIAMAASGQTPQQAAANAYINRPQSQTVGYKAPKPKAAKKPKKPSTSGYAYPRNNTNAKVGDVAQLPLIDPYQAAADYITQQQTDTVTEYNKEVSTVNSLDKQLVAANNAYRDTKAGPHGAAARQTIQLRINRLGPQRDAAKRQLAGLKKAATQAQKDYVRDENDKQEITRLTDVMNAAATRYNTSGDPTQLTSWNAAHKTRDHYLNDLQALLIAVKKRAPAAFQEGLAQQIASNDGAIASAQADGEPTAPTPSLSDFLTKTGRDGTLATLTEAAALAAVNNVPDNPATPYVNESTQSLGDDLVAAGQLKDFYANALSDAQSSGQSAGIITDAANAYVTARDSYQSLSDTIKAGTVGAQQQVITDGTNYSNARNDLYTNFGDNFTGPPSPVWSQPSAGSAVGTLANTGQFTPTTSRSGASIQITNNYPTPPPDPHTYSQGLAWELQAAL